MKIKQLSLFVENRPGALNKVCQTLKEHNISIRTLSLADTQQPENAELPRYTRLSGSVSSRSLLLLAKACPSIRRMPSEITTFCAAQL